MRLVVFLLILLSPYSSWGMIGMEKDSTRKRKSPYLDTNYVLSYKDRLVISGYQSIRNYNLDIRPLFLTDSNGAHRIDYRTNANNGTGIGVDYDKISFSLGRRTPGTPENERSKGRTYTNNLSFSLNGKRHRIETYYRKMTGLYDGNYSKFGTPPKDSLVIHYQDPSLSITETRGKFFWYFDRKRRFSYAAAYSNTQRQIKSAGAFLINTNLYGIVVQSDSNLIPLPSRPFYTEQTDMNRIRSIGFSIAPGFSYNLVLFRSLFANATFSWGPELQFRKTSGWDSGDRKSVKLGMSSAEFRASFGYNGKYLFIFWFLMGDINAFDAMTSTNVSKTLLYQGGVIGYRFRFENRFTEWLQNNRLYKLI